MNISFQKTQDEFLQLKKTVTRRLWKPRTAERFKIGSIHSALSHLPYSPNSRRLGAIRAVKDAYSENLSQITLSELKAEGGRWRSENEFFLEFVKDIARDLPNLEVSVARFVPVSLYWAEEKLEVPIKQTASYNEKTLELFAGYELDFHEEKQFGFISDQLQIFQNTVSKDPAALFLEDSERNLLDWLTNTQMYYFGVKCWLEYAAANYGKMPERIKR